ncbi:MAG: hypothetical protein Q4D45_06720 [Lachnospiraceae bacterium]|nr:hypothetical protein [Lachnospiraceae bacterium]
MKSKKMLIFGLLCFCLIFTTIGCGSQKEETKKETETKTEETTTEVVTTEKVTEFAKNVKKISFEDITNGINFKTSGTKVTLSFEDIDQLDTSLGLEFSLTDAAYEKDPVTIEIKKGQSDYTFENLKKGEEYYLEVYPTKSAKSDAELEKINEKNNKCIIKLEQ